MAIALLALVAVFVAVALAKLAARKHTVAGVPWHAEHVFGWGSTSFYALKIATGATTIPEENLRCHRGAGWRPYGMSFFGGKTVVNIVSPEDVKYLLRDAFHCFEKAPEFQEAFEPLIGRGIFNANGERWKEQRVVAAHMFSRRQLRERMGHVFGVHAQRLVRVVNGFGGRPFDMQAQWYWFAFDAVNDVAFGRRAGSLSGDAADRAFQAAFDRCQQALVSRFTVPWWKLHRRFQSSRAERTVTETTATINAYVDEVVREQMAAHEEANGRPETLTGLVVQARVDAGGGIDRKGVRDALVNFLIAGRDTTASGLTSAVEYLTAPEASGAEWQAQLLSESNRVFGSKPSRRDPLAWDDVSEGRAPVAEAVFLEALRLHPPVASNEKVCVAAAAFPSGVRVAPGQYVGWCPISTNRVPGVWGDRADEFDPARWITPAGGITTEYDEYAYPTFNAGPRLCLGRNMALLEAKIALLTLFAHFRLARAHGSVTTPVNSVTWQMAPGFTVVATQREES